ncbi:MAG: GTP-binding protein [Novosphingobium sp.]|uniref:sulfate adenylyltransferase subunit 1 n=1 Tax=Novosphingobium sp. TaxID=1874826 RepID=UPI0022BE620D|nr:GTP-binding protein [Novosphingobium sp.]MCZ8035956.1 GTP-binding protein [Novosphingobium sp.]
MSVASARQRATTVPVPGDGPANDDGPRTRSLLRFITCGSVDDGKSTLIGRILYETGAVFEDQLGTLKRDSRKFGTQGDKIDFALLVDGLTAEREQGITIDVAYRYFSTPQRAFIVADTPGHEQYTRNMATGASTADLAVILVDARLGLLKQTLRHSFIVSLVGVRHVVVAINKMDLVGYDEAVFERICAEYRAATAALGFAQITFIPVSARDGDNVTTPSAAMRWYRGEPLLAHLESVSWEDTEQSPQGAVLPVQWVNRPDSTFRGYSGNLAQGQLKPGDAVAILPSGRTSQIARILAPSGDVGHASAGQALTVTLTDEIDISRGDVIVDAARRPPVRQTMEARLLWTSEVPLAEGQRYALKLASAHAHATVSTLHFSIDVASLAPVSAATLAMNDIGKVTIDLDRPIAVLPFTASTQLGGFILVDMISHETVAFGFVEAAAATTSVVASPGRTGSLAAFRSALQLFVGPAGSLARTKTAGAIAGHVITGAVLGVFVYGATESLGTALLVVVVDWVFRPLIVSAASILAQRVWLRRDHRNQLASENVLGDGI